MQKRNLALTALRRRAAGRLRAHVCTYVRATYVRFVANLFKRHFVLILLIDPPKYLLVEPSPILIALKK